jgi:hypothetical protein
MNSEALKQFIRQHSYLFWDIREDAKENLSLNAVVETILKYGHVSDIRKLFDLAGIQQVSEIFHEQISRRRVNYPQRTVHFFSNYFNKHAR